MPYPVLPPSPPDIVEVQSYPADAEPGHQFSLIPPFEENTTTDISTDASAASPRASWPSLLSTPDVFSTEFSGQSAIAVGTQLGDYDAGSTDASLLGESFSIGDEGDEHSLQFLPGFSLEPSRSEGNTSPTGVDILIGESPANPTTVSNHSTVASSFDNPQDLDPAIARRSAQMEDDMKELARELLDPLDQAFLELYRFAQTVEQEEATTNAQSDGNLVVPADADLGDDDDNAIPGLLENDDPGDAFPEIAPPDETLPGEPEMSPPGDTLPGDVEDSEIPAPSPAPSEDVLPGDVEDSEIPAPSPTPSEDALPGDVEDSESPAPLDDEPLVEPDPTPPSQPDVTPNAGMGDVIELNADRQIYDTERRVFIAEGNVEMMARGAVLNAERVQVNLSNRVAVAEGDVVFTRGEQVLRGDRIEYNIVREEGSVIDARGEIFLPGVSADLAPTRTDASARADAPPLSTQLSQDQPTVETATTTGGITIGGSLGQQGGLQGGAGGGEVRQLRFEADTIDFYPGGWEASNVRITNDPFSPPELELRANRATFTRLSPTRSELIAANPRLVFDQGLSVPLFRRRFIFDEDQRNDALFQIGFDEDDRDGVFIERTFEPLTLPFAQFSIRPQFFVQRTLDRQEDEDGDEFSLPDAFGLISNLDVDIDNRTNFEGRIELTSLDFSDFEDEARGSVRLNRGVLPLNLPYQPGASGFHTLTAEYSYRDRLFNGTLGFQTVQRTYGVVLTSPVIRLTEPDIYGQGLDLTYQAAIQRINADINFDRREDLLDPPPRENNRTTLTRYQVAAQLRRNFFLWRGQPLPATPEEGLKYTPSPVVPFVSIVPRVQGIASFYSSGDSQPILTGELTLQGQFGHFSRPYLDYFGFSASYRRSTEGSESPFNFDRLNDREVLSGSVTTQLYGPVRVGFRTSINLDDDEEFDNSFFIEYSRRTYGIVLTYNPDREQGSLGLRLSDFTWTGVPERFDAPDDNESDDERDERDASEQPGTDADTDERVEELELPPESSSPYTPEAKPPESPPVEPETANPDAVNLELRDFEPDEEENEESEREVISGESADLSEIESGSIELDVRNPVSSDAEF